MCATEALEGAPRTLGYPSPEVTLPDHPQQPVSPLGRHKDDIHAVGVMGLQFLSAEGNMPFGPTKEQWEHLQHDPSALSAVRESVINNHRAWVSHTELPAYSSQLQEIATADFTAAVTWHASSGKQLR